ncbi:alcohol dehydrogenase [Atractiella rhizophila]|nr:alcohol dehydrogenase [Atractiella rhizophila]
MKAAVLYGQEDVRVEEVAKPDIRQGDVLIRVAWGGICGSDMHMLKHPLETQKKPHSLTGEKLPVVMGHEFSGVIEESKSQLFQKGDRVCVNPLITCGECERCKAGLIGTCKRLGFIGMSVFCEDLLKLRKQSVSLADGALVEPFAVGWHAMRVSKIEKGQSALVLGGGPIGLLTIQCLRAAGVKPIICSEVAQARKSVAISCGADYVFDPTSVDLVEEVEKLTNGVGVHCSFECTGVEACLNQAIRATKFRGTVVVLSLWGQKPAVDMMALLHSERYITGSACHTPNDIRDVLDALEKKTINTDNLITAKISIEDIVEKGFEALLRNKDNHVKILVGSE